ncbi:MAG: MBL fold metallo-hydrolase [Verrucomicrobia bacterium GWC2_42_7]|nr:MAG: MBL fold metallo-hydrolase [Verrucomicrobia bacterium GWC2_42_7]
MKLTVLGCGTSEGVPLLIHPNDGLDLNNSKNWRTRSSIHVEIEDLHIQVDVGPDFRGQCLANKITKMDAVFLTHGHADHILGMDDLRRFCTVLGKPLPVYGNQDTLQRVREVFPYAVAETPAAPGYPCFGLIEMPSQLKLPQCTIQSVVLPHGPCKVLGFVFTESVSGKKIAYYCDCKQVTQDAFRLAKNADVVILDGLRPHSHESHMTLAEAIDVATELNAKQSFITHMSFFIDYKKHSQSMPPHIHLAYDGLVVNL